VKAAAATAPDAEFIKDDTFSFNPVKGWETCGEAPEGWVLEANGAIVKIQEEADNLVFWEGYDSYLAAQLLGDLAWAKIKVDKRTRRISLEERYPENQLPFRGRNSLVLFKECLGVGPQQHVEKLRKEV
jgi:hypothetical protein